MGNKVARVILGIVIIVGILVGAYFILPGSVHYPIKAFIQEKTNDNYSKVIEPLKAAKVPKNKDFTFGDAFESNTEHPAWTIEESDVDDKGNGSYIIYADGFNITVALESEENSDGLITRTNAHFRCRFDVTKEGSVIKVNNKTMEEGKPIYPSQIEVDQDVYSHSNTSNDYYQKCLDSLCGK